MQETADRREMAPPFAEPIVFPEVDECVLAREAAAERRPVPQQQTRLRTSD